MSIAWLYDIKRTIRSEREDAIFPRGNAAVAARLCNICYVSQAKYTCPSCSAPYCSVSCFRSNAHEDCSARFSAAALREHIEVPDEEERQNVLDILHRLEKGDDVAESEEEESRVWWEDENLAPTETEDKESFAKVVRKLLTPGQTARDLSYNLLAILMAYAFVLHQLGAVSLAELVTSREDEVDLIAATFGLLDTLVPFLASKDSLLLSTAEEVSLFVLGRLDLSQIDTSPASLLIQLLKDADKLLQPEKIVAESDESPKYRATASISPAACRHTLTVSAIWDLFYFLKKAPSLVSGIQTKAKAAQHKLAFYTAKALLTDNFVFLQPALQADMYNEMQRLERELKGAKKDERFAAAAKVLDGGESIDILPA